MGANLDDSPWFVLWSAINGLHMALGNVSYVESEAERREKARELHIGLMNMGGQLASDRANRMLAEGAKFEECFAELTAWASDDRWEPEPPTDGGREGFARMADGLITNAEKGKSAIQSGGAFELDSATQTNSKGQPRSIELALLFDRASSVGRDLQGAVTFMHMDLGATADLMRELAARFGEINREILAVMGTPAKFRPTGTSQLAELVEGFRNSIADGERRAREGDAANLKLPPIRETDRQIYQLYTGGLNQEQIAQAMTKATGKPWAQPRISEALTRVRNQQNASGLSELLPKPAVRERAVDPQKLEMGQRTDGRSKTLRAKERQSASENS